MPKPLDQYSEVVDEGRRWTADWYNWLRGISTPLVVQVASLPSAARAGAGERAFVTDSTTITLSVIVVGGGANMVPVYSDGTNWRVG